VVRHATTWRHDRGVAVTSRQLARTSRLGMDTSHVSMSRPGSSPPIFRTQCRLQPRSRPGALLGCTTVRRTAAYPPPHGPQVDRAPHASIHADADFHSSAASALQHHAERKPAAGMLFGGAPHIASSADNTGDLTVGDLLKSPCRIVQVPPGHRPRAPGNSASERRLARRSAGQRATLACPIAVRSPRPWKKART
jgi:hypothetical protein